MSAFTPCVAYDALKPSRDQIASLLAGTEGMRIAGERYLPKNENESTSDYANRLINTTLFNQFARAISTSIGKVLAKPITFSGTNSAVDAWLEDINLEGDNMDHFAKVWFGDALAYGVSFVVVDMPKSQFAVRTLATDQQEGIRPYLVHVPVNDLINWQIARVNGVKKLTMVVYREDAWVQSSTDEFQQVLARRVRVLRPGSWQLIQQFEIPSDDGKTTQTVDQVIDEGFTGLDYIPIVATYTNTKEDIFIAKAPFQNLAELNVRHWQSSSDQANILRIARVPILHVAKTSAIALDETGQAVQAEDDLTIGGNTCWVTDADTKITFVEHSGEAISSGRQEMQDLLDEMVQVSFQLVARETSGDVTATETSVMSAEANAFLSALAENFKDSIEQALKLMCDMANIALEPEAFINKEFGNTQVATDMQIVLNMQAAGIIKPEVVVECAKRRGILPEDTVTADVMPEVTEVVTSDNTATA